MSEQLSDDVLQGAVDALREIQSSTGDPTMAATAPPSPLVLVGLTAVLSLILYIMAEIGEAGTGNKPDISRADHCNLHTGIPLS